MTKKIARWLVGSAVVFVVYGLFVLYPGTRLFGLLSPDTPIGWVIAVLCLPIAARLWLEIRPSHITLTLNRISITFAGICFAALPMMLGFEALNALVDIPQRAAGITLLVLVVALATYGVINALTLHTKTIEVSAPAPARGVTLAQISDLHVGSLHPRILKRVVKATNATQPDYVLLTGDIVDLHGVTAEELAPLADLAAPAYFIIGNHERYVDCDDICERIASHGVKVLRNAEAFDGPFQFVGIDDAESKQQVARHLPHFKPSEDHFRVLLYHRPDGVEDAAAWGADLMLCGHTHNGQIVPFNYAVKRVFPLIAGDYQIDQLTLHVSTGTGVWGPILRIGSRSEISVLKLV